MIEAFVFVVFLHLTSFGGPVKVTVEATTVEGCWKLRRMFTAGELREMVAVRTTPTECERVERPQ